MQLERVGRAVPFTENRAATELIRCQRHIELAREALELVVQIQAGLSAGGAVSADDPDPSLDEILGRLEEAEASLREVMT